MTRLLLTLPIALLLTACDGKSDDTSDPCDTGDTAYEDCSIGGNNDGGGPGGDAGNPGGPGGDNGGNPGGGDSGLPQGAWLEADIVASDGQSFTYTSTSLLGGYNGEDWGFAALGSDITNALTVNVASPSPSTGSYPISTSEDGRNYGAYTDFVHYSYQTGGFVSNSGTLTVTSVVDNPDPIWPGYLVSGEFTLQLDNRQEENFISMTVTGTFQDAIVTGD